MRTTKDSILKELSGHTMDVLRDDGVYRHLVFSNNGSCFFRFEIVTWPGYLAYTGDMGAFVFFRTNDMFRFFRNDEGKINPCYWAEKVVAENKNEGIKKFSIDIFRRNVLSRTKSHLNLEDDDEIPDEMMREIISLLAAEDFIEAIARIRDFRSEKINFHDWWEFDNDEYTTAFIICCYAIVWAIGKYDAAKEVVA